MTQASLMNGSFDQSNRVKGHRRHPASLVSVVALTTAIIVGVPLGDGLGIALIQARDRPSFTAPLTATSSTASEPAASTTTSGQLVNYTAAPADTVYSVPLECPGLDRTTYNTYNAQSWSVSCQRAAYMVATSWPCWHTRTSIASKPAPQ